MSWLAIENLLGRGDSPLHSQPETEVQLRRVALLKQKISFATLTWVREPMWRTQRQDIMR